MDWERRFVLAESPEASRCSRGEDLRDKRVHTQGPCARGRGSGARNRAKWSGKREDEARRGVVANFEEALAGESSQ